MKTLGQLRQYPRDYFDTDELELSNALLDTWAYEGDVHIAEATKGWVFWEVLEPLAISTGVETYAIPATVKEIQTIEGEDGPLMFMGRREALHRYEPYGASPVYTGRPQTYSVFANTIRIYPKPDANYTMTIAGYRKRTDWIAAGENATPDFPQEFEPALISWMMHRAYMHQDDPEMADRERERFQEIVQRLLLVENQGAPTEVVIGGHRRTLPLDALPRYPWEG